MFMSELGKSSPGLRDKDTVYLTPNGLKTKIVKTTLQNQQKLEMDIK